MLCFSWGKLLDVYRSIFAIMFFHRGYNTERRSTTERHYSYPTTNVDGSWFTKMRGKRLNEVDLQIITQGSPQWAFAPTIAYISSRASSKDNNFRVLYRNHF